MAASENNICLLFVYFSLNLFEISLNSLLVRSSLRKFRYVEMPPYPERKTEPSHSCFSFLWHPFVQELVCLTTDNVQLINSKFYTLNCLSHP